ncbi:hypothetical protein V6Z12_A10G125000 [Gossypium hirsutum]
MILDLKAREKEHKAKEAKLNKHEQELRRKEDAIARGLVLCLTWNVVVVTIAWIKGEGGFSKSNSLVSCHYIFHIWGPWWLRNVVSLPLSCYEGYMGHGC